MKPGVELGSKECSNLNLPFNTALAKTTLEKKYGSERFNGEIQILLFFSIRILPKLVGMLIDSGYAGRGSVSQHSKIYFEGREKMRNEKPALFLSICI